MSEYNGWTNRATWLVKLHLDNTKAWQDAMLALAAVHAGDDTMQPLAESIASFVEEVIHASAGPIVTDGDRLLLDMLTDVSGDVNWREIAKAYRDELI